MLITTINILKLRRWTSNNVHILDKNINNVFITSNLWTKQPGMLTDFINYSNFDQSFNRQRV